MIPLASSDTYVTPDGRASVLRRVLPAGTVFYLHLARVVVSASRKAKRGRYTDADWVDSSIATLRGLEAAGCRFRIEGMRHITAFDGPGVFIGNHMSTNETFVLPGLINPVKPIAFVIKPSLMEYPFFRHVMRSRNPIVVSRDNPRQDLVTVLEGGRKKIESGISVVLFPQTTRVTTFDPTQFNTLGVKLAKNCGVPVVPIALKTDAWGNGKRVKELGRIDPSKTIHYAFGEPMPVSGNGRETHDQVVAFIRDHLAAWTA